MSFLRQTAKQILATCVPHRRLLLRGPRRVNDQLPRLALTFDDGPHPVHTLRLLDVLRKAQVSATFFVVGKEAVRYPDLIRRIAADGHELGNHTWSHEEPAQTSGAQFLKEVLHTDELLRDLTGVIPTAVRPPKGEVNWAKLSGLWRQGKTVALWNVDPRDYRMSDSLEMTNWVASYTPSDGDVLLFHDNHPWAADAVLAMAQSGMFDRYRAVTVSEMVQRVQSNVANVTHQPVVTIP